MGVVVNIRAKDKNSLILTSDEFVPAPVVHSSIHMIHPDTVEQQGEDRQTLESPGISSVPRGRGRGVRRSELESPGISSVSRGRGRGNQ